jgi:hypothetical protein
MLRELLRELERATEPMTLRELSRRTGVDESALEGMIAHLVRIGRLADDASTPRDSRGASGGHSGGAPVGAAPGSHSGACASCGGAAGCPFVARVPRAISLRATKGAHPVASG